MVLYVQEKQLYIDHIQGSINRRRDSCRFPSDNCRACSSWWGCRTSAKVWKLPPLLFHLLQATINEHVCLLHLAHTRLLRPLQVYDSSMGCGIQTWWDSLGRGGYESPESVGSQAYNIRVVWCDLHYLYIVHSSWYGRRALRLMAELNTRKDHAIAWYLKSVEDEIWDDDAVTCNFPALLYMKWPGTLV